MSVDMAIDPTELFIFATSRRALSLSARIDDLRMVRVEKLTGLIHHRMIAAGLLPLLMDVVAWLTQRLERACPEEISVTTMRLDMVSHGGLSDLTGGQTEATQWLSL